MKRRGCDYPYAFRENQLEQYERLDSYIAKTVAESQFTYISQLDLLDITLPEDLLSCEALFWQDGDHLSAAGEDRFGARLDLMRLTGVEE